jgi:ATP-dependent DNA helicase RecG
MSITIVEISPAQRDQILAVQEGQFSDLKAIDVRPAKLTEFISAFANSDGGELYIGIDENKAKKTRTWRGFDNQEAANGHIQIFEQLFPLGQDFQYTFLSCQGEFGLVLQVQILKTQDIKLASDGVPYIRRSAQKLPVTTPEALRRLEYGKGLTSFETELINAPTDIITNSVPALNFILEVVPSAEPESWLHKQQLIKNGKPTVAGILLFAEEPQALLPKRSGIKVYRYKTQAKEGFREVLAFNPITVEGCLYDQIRSAVNVTTQTVEEIKKLGDESLENIKYPSEAIHEIITNAVLHRDYSLPDDVHIRVFDNRIEVESPGRLPGHITIRNILDERFARNGTLVRILNKFPDAPNKDVGEGLNTAFLAMVQLGLKEPVIMERDNSVLVAIKHEPLASPEEAILEYLKNNPTIKNSIARKICHISTDYTIKNIFNELVDAGLIEKVPGTNTSATAYQLVNRSG